MAEVSGLIVGTANANNAGTDASSTHVGGKPELVP